MRYKLNWTDWNPGLDNDQLTLGEVLASMPAAAPEAIPWLVRLLENPASPVAFPGAISLARHDAIHALLGRGLANQDEAFVIGFTMGAAKTVRNWQFRLYRFVASHWYPKAYRFQRQDLIAFDLGHALGERSKARDLHLVPFESLHARTLATLRAELAIDVHALHAVYRAEAAKLPHTRSSRRLDRDFKNVDPSDLYPPDGQDSDWKSH